MIGKPMKNCAFHSLLFSLFLCGFFLISPVSSYIVGTTIDQGASVYLGEQGLNITHALNQGSPHAGSIDDVPLNTTIGWWAPASVIDVDSPTRTFDTSVVYQSFTVNPAVFAGYTGTWYVIDNSTGFTASGAANSMVFNVIDPSIDLIIWDFSSSSDVSGTSVPFGDFLGFRITTNHYNALDYTYRSPISNSPSDGYIDIMVRNESGFVYTNLFNSSALPNSLLQHNVSFSPWTWGNAPSAPFTWSTGVTSAGQPVYLPGYYSVFAESNLNGMRENYPNAGADYVGRTVSLGEYVIIYGSPEARFTATPVSGTVPLIVQFTDSSTGPPAAWNWIFGDGFSSTMQNPTHTYNSAGAYSVSLTIMNAGGSNTTTQVNYITVTTPDQPSGGDPDPASSIPAPPPVQQAKIDILLPAPPLPPVQEQSPPPLAPVKPELQPVEGLSGVTVVESYPVGFAGMSYNTAGGNIVNIDLNSARDAGATVTMYNNRVTVYQHNSPGVLITFWGDQFEYIGGKIIGLVSRADLITDPLTVNVSSGKVAGSVQVVLTSINQPVTIENAITGEIPVTVVEQYKALLAQDNQSLAGIAYLMRFQRGSLTTTGSANVTMTVPQSWVERHGGKDEVKIIRISDETRVTELLKTTYLGLDPQGDMVFCGDSPLGTSLFGMVTAKAVAMEEEQHPGVTYIPASQPAMITNVGMYGWIINLIQNNPLLIVIIITGLAAILCFIRWKR